MKGSQFIAQFHIRGIEVRAWFLNSYFYWPLQETIQGTWL